MNANTQAVAAEPLLLRLDDGGVVTLTLNRPAQFNSLSQALMSALQAELERIAADSGVRAVIIAGAGKAFCAGHDLKEMRSDASKEFHKQLFRQCSKLMLTLVRIPQPVIARVHGIATAAGCQLVSMCDLAVASDNSRFAVSGVNLGLFCTTPSVGLSRNLGRKQAMEMLLTGEFIDAQTALARGLVNRVV
ncbi:MAG: enoyl-CoA hydratase-related protein, partial [Giesbergeria sp.]